MTGAGPKPTCRDVCFWHIADKPTAPAFVRFWATADKVTFGAAAVCPLMTQSGRGWTCRDVHEKPPVSDVFPWGSG